MRILLVEDKLAISRAVAAILQKNNYIVDVADNGADGLALALDDIYDLIILDIMLPRMNGLEVLKAFRKENKTTPVIILTARGEVSDKIIGLDCGADDYLAKPFDSEELLARIRATVRRKGEIVATDSTSIFGDIKLNTQTLQLSSSGDCITITLKESQLLEYLIDNHNLVLSKEKIIEKIWNYDSEAVDNHVEVYISFLRKKLRYINAGVSILTIRGVGYKLCLKN